MSATPEFTHSAADLLHYEPFVRSIARALISDEDRVGDVVQETWLRALTKRPRDTRAFRGWLGRVARNLAMDQYRRESNIKHRERGVAREEAVEADERDLELHGKVVQAVLDLEDPYKSVVMLHYYRGMNLARVAKELNRNAATVRSQLLRAHELLRGKMDGQFDGERASWMALCLPLAAGRRTLAGSFGLAKVAAVLLLVTVAITGANALSTGDTSLDKVETHAAMLASPGTTEPENQITQTPSLFASEQDPRTPITAGESILVTQAGVPVEGADVWRLLINEAASEEAKNDPNISPDPERIFKKLGQHSRTGKDGRASLNFVSSDFAILVMKGAYLKILTVDEVRVTPLEAKLEKGAAVAIRTVDTRGNPLADIPIILRCAENRSDRDGNSNFMMWDVTTRKSAPSTGAVLFRAMDQFYPSQVERSWSIRVGIPGIPSQQTRVDLERSIEDPIVLEIGDTGSMVIRVVDEQGEVIALQGTARLRSSGLEQASLSLPLIKGVAKFPLVGASSRLSLSIEVPELGTTWTSDQQGPSRAGETKTLDFSQPNALMLSGEVIGIDGKALVNSRLSFLLVGEPDEHFMPIQIKTDEAGRFQLKSDPRMLRSGRSVMLLQYGAVGIEAYASSGNALQLANDTKSLGKFHMQETAGFVEGICVSTAGSPLAGIHVAVGCIAGYRDTRYTTGPDGRFYLGGVFPAEPRLRIEASDDWILAAPVTATAGQRDVELVLAPGGAIEGTVAMASAMRADLVIVSAQFESEMDSVEARRETTCDPADGGFRLGGLRSGRYTLKVELRNGTLGTVTVRTIEHVVVNAPSASIDPRVSLIDLSGEARSIRFKVLDSNDTPLDSRRVIASVLSSGEQIATGLADRDGQVILTYIDTENAIIRVEAEGYRSTSFQAVPVPKDVVLLPGIPVELTYDQRTKTRSKDTVYILSLHRMEAGAATRDKISVPSELIKSGTCEVTFPAPGRYQLFYSMHNINPHHGPSEVSVARMVPGKFFVDVSDSETQVSLRLQLPTEWPE